jgi:hypothetical protein
MLEVNPAKQGVEIPQRRVGCVNPIRIEIAVHVGLADRLLGVGRRVARPI